MTLALQDRRGLSPAAKAKLADVVSDLRTRLIRSMGDALQSTYRLSVKDLAEADLDESARRRRQRLEAWLDEQVRGACRGAKETYAEARQRHIQKLVKLAAATFLNRLVVLRQMEALGLVRVKVLTGGWDSPGYRNFRDFAPALLEDETEGYAELLRLAFDELALDLPGLYGDLGPTALVPLPGPTLRLAVETLGHPLLAEAWTDDTTLGWVYQFWNDPDREALDEKIGNRGKIENHEIAAKTQLFTDRYMVEWLLQNSLGQLWLSICVRNGWTPEVQGNGTLDRLEARRIEWRAKRDAGEVALDAIMPLQSDEEDRWKYWVPRELPSDSGEHAPATLREVKLLDPACGSGHFLVIAFDLLAAMYEEEARHRGVQWAEPDVARWILEDNLHGIELDPRAVQIAAAALWLKARTRCPDLRPRRMNLVASNLGLGAMPKDDPALLELLRAVEEETGIPARLTATIVEALKGADYLGSLLKVDGAVEAAVEGWEREQSKRGEIPGQGDLFRHPTNSGSGRAGLRQSVVERIEEFLKHHTGADELGLRFRGEQLESGVRFARMLKHSQYDIVVANPPYQGTGKMAQASYYASRYSEGKADLYAAFLCRTIQLLRPCGVASLVSMRGWMFLAQYEDLRHTLIKNSQSMLVADLHFGAFSDMKDVSVALAVFTKSDQRCATQATSIFIRPVPQQYVVRDIRQPSRNTAGLVVQHELYPLQLTKLRIIPGWPLIYRWDDDFLRRYADTQKLGECSPGRAVQSLGDNVRLTRYPWELQNSKVIYTTDEEVDLRFETWTPFLNGAAGIAWYEPVRLLVKWWCRGLIVKLYKAYKTGGKSFKLANEDVYLRRGIAFSMIGNTFSARLHRYRSVFGNKGSSLFPDKPNHVVCLLNSRLAQCVMSSLNPGIGFEVGDVNRLPLFPIESADEIVARLDESFTEHEAHRETSVEFKRSGPSSWTWAQDWAQQAVDREAGAPLPPWEPVQVPEPLVDHLSFALGVAMGRFGAHGEGILDEAPPDMLPHGILFLNNADDGHEDDGLTHPSVRSLHQFWEAHGKTLAPKSSLRDFLRLKFFTDDHLSRYEKRPIYLPLSSEKRNFVAWVSIHRWRDDTLQVLLADHLHPALTRLAGELADLTEARLTGVRSERVKAQTRFTNVQNLHDELRRFVTLVEEIAERGAPPSGKARRHAEARFYMDLDDGVMINAAALWPLLKPQWNDPEKWWVELCDPKGKYDWAHLVARYFPKRVDDKCKDDPSVAVAHSCFWKYHAEKAYQWELRLQSPDELGPDFRLEEPGSDLYRADFERTHPDRVTDLRAAEDKRRQRKAEQPVEEVTAADEEDEEE